MYAASRIPPSSISALAVRDGRPRLAARLVALLDGPSRETVITAAWLHDIGHPPGVRVTPAFTSGEQETSE